MQIFCSSSEHVELSETFHLVEKNFIKTVQVWRTFCSRMKIWKMSLKEKFLYCSLHAKLSTCAPYIAYKLHLAKWQIKGLRDQKKWFLYEKCVNLNVKGPTDYQLHPKIIIIGLILIKRKYYLQLARKLVQAEEFSILFNKFGNNYFLI